MVLRLLVLVLLFSGQIAIAQGGTSSALERVKQMEQQLWAASNQGVYQMTIVTPHWQRTLEIKAWMIRPEKTLIRILAPKKERGVGSLRIRSEMWNYIPKIDRVIKIPPSMMLQPWMGSDFTNDDLVKESSLITDYEHSQFASTSESGIAVVGIRAIPKPDAPAVWGKLEFWLRASDNLPLRQLYYDERGRLVKQLSFDNIQLLGGRLIPTRWTMRSATKTDQHTVIELLSMQFDIAIDEKLFSMRRLRTPDW